MQATYLCQPVPGSNTAKRYGTGYLKSGFGGSPVLYVKNCTGYINYTARPFIDAYRAGIDTYEHLPTGSGVKYPSLFVISCLSLISCRCNKIFEIGQCCRLTKEFNGEVMEFSKD